MPPIQSDRPIQIPPPPVAEEAAWLRQRREQAAARYAAVANPGRVEHLWRYTDPAQFAWPLEPADESAAAGEAAAREAQQALAGETHAAEAIFTRGGLRYAQIEPEAARRGLWLEDLRAAAREREEFLAPRLGAIVHETHGRFEALNAAAWRSGALVRIPRGVALERPVHLVFAGDAAPGAFFSRLLIVAEEGAEATVVVEFASPNAVALSANAVIELDAAANSHTRLVAVQRWGDETVSFLTSRARLARDASLDSVWLSFGARTHKADLGAALAGPGARTRLWGLAFAQGRQHFDHHTVHEHAAPHTQSDLDFKVALKGRARSAYTGLIRIEEDAPGCEAYQENRNLLLSDGPRADSIPELEILNEDVKCTHGATVGPVSREELFYCQARGIPREEALRVIVGGFVEPTLREAPEDLRARLHEYVEERLREI